MNIIDMGMNGEGIAKENGKVFFVKGALLNEEVEVKILEEKKNFSNAIVTKIIEASKDRVKPLCPYFGKCGGCDIQHLSYEKQLQFKQDLVKNTLKKIGGIEINPEQTISSKNQFNYRNKSVFRVFEEKGETKLGMIEQNSNQMLEVKQCKIASDGINQVLELTADFLRNKKPEGLKCLVIREVKEDFLITLVVEDKSLSYLQDYLKLLKSNLKKFSLNLNISNNKKEILSDEFIPVYGRQFIDSCEFDFETEINSASFMQVNDDVKTKLYSRVLEEISRDEVVVDAYCGAGLLSGLISKKVKFVYGVEICAPAVDAANEMAKQNDLKNTRFICGDRVKILPKLLKEVDGKFSLVLDPPRKGCDERVLTSALATHPKKIIYISCSPISLVKNLKILCEGGYKIKSVTPFDMFPETVNIETLVVLEK